MSLDDLYNPDYIKSLLVVNEINLESDLATCSSFFFTFSALAVDAEQLYDRATLKLETHEADLGHKFATENPEAEITQTEIKRRFRQDEKWNELKEDQLKCHRNFKIVEKAAKAFEMKSNNMANLNRRQIAKAGNRIEDYQ